MTVLIDAVHMKKMINHGYKHEQTCARLDKNITVHAVKAGYSQ